MQKKFKLTTLGLATLALAGSAFAQSPLPDHVIISEIGQGTPAGTEFTEIYNPTNATVDISNYFLSDYFQYFNLPSIANEQLDNSCNGNNDHILKFPPGSSLPPGGVAVVVLNATKMADVLFEGDINNFYNLPGSPQLFEIAVETLTDPNPPSGNPPSVTIYVDDPAVPNMDTKYHAADPDYPFSTTALPADVTPDHYYSQNNNHTDGNENEVLFYWDGNSSLVSDVDMVQWLEIGNTWGTSTNQITDKTGLPQLGPSNILENYAADNGTAEGMTAYHPDGNSAMTLRRSLIELSEVKTGGNGITGHDATTELNNSTWKVLRGHLTNNGAGVPPFLASDNQPPVIGKATRDIQFPAPGAPVHISVPIEDDGTFTAKLYVAKGPFAPFLPINMVNEGGNIYGADITGLTEGMHVYWYVTATDNNGVTVTENDYKEYDLHDPFAGYHSFMASTADTASTSPYTTNTLVVSEVMYNPQGTNNYSHAQYFEVYNPSATAFDASGFVVTTNFQQTPDVVFPTVIRIPKGTVIPANGYMVITAKKTVFMKNYPGIDSNLVVDFDITPAGTSFIAHAGSEIRFFGPNDYGFDDAPVPDEKAFKLFAYQNNANGWPDGDTASAIGAGNTGYPIELKTLAPGDDNIAANWAVGHNYNGTPLAANYVDTSAHSADIAVITATRNIVYPNSTDTITITALTTSSAAITEAKVWVNSGSGFTATPMTVTGGPTDYTATGDIGPFPDNTLVKYYVSVTDGAKNAAFPYTAPVTSVPFWVQNTPVKDNAIVINEILNDNYGADNGNYAEFAELYNRSESPVDLSYYMVGLNKGVDQNACMILPEGTIIQSHAYLVLAADKQIIHDNFYTEVPGTGFYHKKYGLMNPYTIFDFGWSAGSKFNNTADEFYMGHANEVDFFGGADSIPYITINYDEGAGWPTADRFSMELKTPDLDPTDGANWLVSTASNGTPGLRNSVTPPPAAVSDWTLY